MKGTKQTTGGISVIRMYDPAVDTANLEIKDAWNEYALSRNPDLIAKIIRAGDRPTRFYVLKATRRGMRHIRGGADAAERHERAFAVCVSKVSDLRIGDGVERRSEVDIPTADGATPMSDVILERFAESDIQEIGSVAYAMSFLASDLPAHYPPPATSWRALEALMSRHAEPTSETTTSSSPPSSASQPAEQTPPPSQRGAEPTAATAVET